MTIQILHGDCVEVMKTLPDCSVDAIVTDPPYGLTSNSGGPAKGSDTPQSRAQAGVGRAGFMGMKWDADVPPVEVWREALRVLKPGGYLLAFAGTRTQHRMCTRIEDAGFEIRDMIAWIYGSGFPKSHNGEWGGTSLKPALEPITVARKPLIGTVEANWREHGTGAMNINGCRVGSDLIPTRHTECVGETGNWYGNKSSGETSLHSGRWPANLIHDGSDEVLAAFPDAPGQLADASSSSSSRKNQNVYCAMTRGNGRENEPSGDAREDTGFRMKPGARRTDTGSAARFFAAFPQEDQCKQSDADTADSCSSLQNELAASVASAAAIWPSLAGIHSSGSWATSTTVMATESNAICECVITAMAPIGSGSSLEAQHERLSLCGGRVNVAASRSLTGITTITASLSRSDGSVVHATCSITPTNLERAVQACRFKYCAKADRADRNEGMNDPGPQFKKGSTMRDAENVGRARKGNFHPTVKPTDLMRYLCRLVTPAGGVVLDPFMGSGSTLKAAELEGFSAIGIELDADYIVIARRRIGADAPLFAEVQ